MTGGLTIDGRQICSRVNPEREARLYLNSNDRFIQHAKSVFVLGLSAGHLVRLLASEYPDKTIVVVETRRSLIEEVGLEDLTSKDRVSIIEIKKDGSEIFQSLTVGATLKGSYITLRQNYTRWVDEAIYDDVERLLIARAPEAFSRIRNVREDLQNVLPPIIEVKELASIKTLANHLRKEADGEAKLILKTLRELVV